MSVPASSVSIVFSGKYPYAVVPNACRKKWLSVNPGHAMGAMRAPGSIWAVNSSSASQSGVRISERVPPTASRNSRS